MPDVTFAHYYQAELAYLRGLAQEFGQAFPEVAHLVSERGGDPAAERLFQGAALLTARLRQRVEDDFPELVHPLFEQLWPQYLRPVPATTLLRFSPAANALRQSQVLARGTPVRSRPVGGERGVECVFRTCYPIDLHPLELEEAALTRPVPADLQLRLKLRTSGEASFDNIKLGRLRFQLLGEARTTLALFQLLALHGRSVSVRRPDGETCLRLPARALHLAGLSPQESLCPHEPTPVPALQLLREYFILPEKLLTFELRGLEQVPPGQLKDHFEVVVHLGPAPDQELRLDAQGVAMACVPALNLSLTRTIDLRLAPGSHRLRLPAEGGEVFAVERVRAFDTSVGDWVDYPPFLGAATSSEGDLRPRYLVVRRVEGVDGPQTSLVLTDGHGRLRSPSAEALQVWLTATDGGVASRLGPGELCLPTSGSPEYATFSNVTRVVPGVPAALQRDHFWQLLAQLAIQPREIATRHGLTALLREAAGGGVETRAPEVREVRCSGTSRLYRQTVVPVRRVEVEVDEERFALEGELFLFGRVLSQLFRRTSGSLVFHEVTVRGATSGTCFTFAPDAS